MVYVNLSRKYGAFWAFLRNCLFLHVKNLPGPMMQQNSLYELSGYIFNTFFMMGKGYCTDSRYDLLKQDDVSNK